MMSRRRSYQPLLYLLAVVVASSPQTASLRNRQTHADRDCRHIPGVLTHT